MILQINTFGILSALLFSVLTKADDVPAPQGGLQSNSNYFFFNNNTNNILDLAATITITADLHVSSTGVSFQLIGLSPASNSSSAPASQHFAITFDGTTFGGFIHTFNSAPNPNSRVLFFENTTLATADDTHQDFIPAGTVFTITLTNDENGIVTNAEFGMSQGETGLDIAEGLEITAAATAPNVGFTFIIVGLGNSLEGVFTGGNGTVEYFGQTSFCPLSSVPNVFVSAAQTPETGNSVYGGLAGSEVTDLVQTWQVSS
jgi:hypothetical protein